MNFNLDEILKATNAKIIKNEVAKHEKFTFSTDTRTVKAGEIYLPLKGANFDGEKFIDKALEAGAIGYFCTNANEIASVETPCKYADSMSRNDAKLVLQVPDTLTAYLQLARFYRQKVNPKTVAITGSSGKTTTKEMAYCVSKEKFKTHKSELNFNNEIGLCKTILSMPEDTEVLILEMGMRGFGEIELLSKYSVPDISIIANVGTAHIGRLGSRENIAKAKCEITKYQNDNGILIAHDDDLIKKTVNFNGIKIFFSLNDANIIEKKVGFSKFSYKNHEYELNIEGDYNIQNALSVIEMGLNLNMSPAEINEGLKKYSPIEKRWEMQEIKGLNIINDSYNANPESMQAALKTFTDLYKPPLLMVIGNMAELGDQEVKYHKQIGEFLLKNISQDVNVITVGHLANEITKVLNENGFTSVNFTDNLQTSRYILDNAKIGTTIILKASRSMEFEDIIKNIKN